MRININSKVLLCLSFLLVIIACEDSRMDKMVEDKVYLLKPGINEIDAFLWEDYTYDLMVIKSGIGQQQADLELVIDEAALQKYNDANQTSFELLPPDYYSIKSKNIIINKKEERAPFQIVLETNKLKELLSESDKKYALPCRIDIINQAISSADSAVMYSFIVPTVKEAYLQFTDPGFYPMVWQINPESAGEAFFFSEVNTNYYNHWDITYTLEVDPHLITEYNAANNTNYKILPEGTYSIDKSSYKISQNLEIQAIKFAIYKDKLIAENGDFLFGNYMIPLRIASVSKNGINPDGDVQLIPVSFQPQEISRVKWTIPEWNSCISEEPQYESLGRTPDKMLDGDPTTFWGSKWDEPKPLPYYFVFDMQYKYKIFQLGIVKPNDTWRGNIKSGYFETSEDGSTWTKLPDWEIKANDPRTEYFDIPAVNARYIRFVITEAFEYANGEIGAESGARCDIAEFKAWGLLDNK